jgi:branched-chain amino acid transport system substrate-binding protein
MSLMKPPLAGSLAVAARRRPHRGHRTPRFVALALAMALHATGLRAAPAPIRIGVIAPLTGASSDFGISMQQGAALAVEQINAIGGVLGRPLQLVTRDDGGDAAMGRAASTALLAHENVIATIGFCNTGVALASLDLFEAQHQLLLVPCAQGTALTHRTPPGDSMVFRVAPPDALNAEFLVGEIVDRRRLTRVAVLADTTGYGDGGVADIGAQLKRRGLAPVIVSRFAADAPSLRDNLEQARAAGAQALVVYTVGPGEAAAVRARAAMKWDVPYFGPWTLSFRSVLEAAGPAALEGTMMTQSIIQDSANEARTAFIASFGHRPDRRAAGSLMAAAQAYDSVHLLVRAMFASHGDLAPLALKKALEEPTEPYRGVVTTYDHPFSARDHEAFSLNMIWLGVWRRGEIRYFHASDALMSAAVRRKRSDRAE